MNFSSNQVVIKKLHDPIVFVSIREIDHAFRLYKFVKFQISSTSYFITHVNTLSTIFHERVFHVNYRLFAIDIHSKLDF